MHDPSAAPAAATDQERLVAYLEASADIARELAQSTLRAWQEVPLLALVANGRSGWSGARTATARDGLWKPVHETSVSVRCRDAALVLGSSGHPAPATSIVDALLLRYVGLDGFSGTCVRDELLTSASRVLGDSPAVRENRERIWKDNLLHGQVGFLAGWQQMTGPFHDASEALQGLARNWDQSFGSLLEASVAVLDEPDRAQVHALSVFHAHFE